MAWTPLAYRRLMPPAPTETDPTPERFDDAPVIAAVELDRYCSYCGYNLRQQQVRREPTTALLLCRCPECGTFEPANQLLTKRRTWLGQLGAVLWLLWIVGWVALMGVSVKASVDLAVEAGELRADVHKLDKPRYYRTGAAGASARQVNTEYRLGPLNGNTLGHFASILAAVFAIGFGLITLVTMLLAHWPSKGYTTLAVGWPLIAVAVVSLAKLTRSNTMAYATDGLAVWLHVSAWLVALAAVLGGLTAVPLGRPIARLIVRMAVPVSKRGPFAYLWLADGKPVPTTRWPKRDATTHVQPPDESLS